MNPPTQHLGHCPSCGRCWHCVKPHVVWLNDRSGVGVLCNGCWGKVSPAERIRFHFGYWLRNAKWWERLLVVFDWLPASWERLSLAVDSALLEEFTGYCQTCGEDRRVPADKRNCPVCERPLMASRRKVNA